MDGHKGCGLAGGFLLVWFAVGVVVVVEVETESTMKDNSEMMTKFDR